MILPVPSNETPPIVLAVSSAVAVAAFPEVSWLPEVLTPGKLIAALPSKDTPPIVLAVASLVAVLALPVRLPVTPPLALIAPANDETPTTLIPFWDPKNVDTPDTTIPLLAVIKPTESILVTSSYVSSPVTSKSPVILAPVLVVSKRFVLSK